MNVCILYNEKKQTIKLQSKCRYQKLLFVDIFNYDELWEETIISSKFVISLLILTRTNIGIQEKQILAFWVVLSISTLNLKISVQLLYILTFVKYKYSNQTLNFETIIILLFETEDTWF